MSGAANLVTKDDDGNFNIGPLTEDQYTVITDALELAAAWTERKVNPITARVLRSFIPDVDDV